MPRLLLIVDDSATNRGVLKIILRSEYEIIEAENGQEALDILSMQYKQISAVLLDIVMPVMDGFETLRRMRLSQALKQIPVIITTGQQAEDTELKALTLGASDYVTKPYNAPVIRQRLYNAINLRETAAAVTKLQMDELTGIYNRKAFLEKAETLIKEREPGYYVISCVNIDNFKVINDQHGTAKGDEVLIHVAKSVSRFVNTYGGICCRFTADNFGVLYPRSIMDKPQHKANHMQTMSTDCIGQSIHIRIGRYAVDAPAFSVSAMYDRATLAADSIKGRYDAYIAFYDESMRAHILREQEIVDDMKDALRRNQFEVWFQPQFNHASGALIGAEALVRWRHPARGLVSPGDFIPIFEKNGFIYELDKFVWEKSCSLLRRWIDKVKNPVHISVNVSRYDMLQNDLAAVITGIMRKYSIPMNMLCLEVTESTFAGSNEKIIDTVEKLVQAGFTVEIDDFGSGYSSLNTLKDVPAGVLKLDMRFLESSRASNRGGNIIESVVRMAKWLGLPVIAEGVETIEQAEYLKTIGCYYVQGYLYAKPMPSVDFETFISGFDKTENKRTLRTVDNLDNNAFWDPKSMDTLIFNSFVGGACIFEYYNGQTELLRANDEYARVLGADSLARAESPRGGLYGRLDDNNARTLAENIKSAIATNEQSTCEVWLKETDEGLKRVCIRATARVIAIAEDRYLLYSSIQNVTPQKNAEINEREAKYRMLSVINDMPLGYIRMKVLENGDISPEFANDGFYRLVDMTREAHDAEFGADAYACVHPDDVEMVRAAAAEMLAGEAPVALEYRIRHGSSGYIMAEVYGRASKNERGETYLNLYYRKKEGAYGRE